MKALTRLLLPILFCSFQAQAADHLDGDAVQTDASTDITDVYAWMSTASKLAMIINVNPVASSSSTFSTAAEYVFHVTSGATYGDTSATETTVNCRFASNTDITCTLNGSTALVTNEDASATTGVSNSGDTFKVFAGRRNDPFYFDLANFNQVQQTVVSVAGSLDFDAGNCPTLTTSVRDDLASALTGGGANATVTGATATANFFGSLDVLSIVVEADATLFGSGPIYGVWGTTNRL